jgi:hypothetical protein
VDTYLASYVLGTFRVVNSPLTTGKFEYRNIKLQICYGQSKISILAFYNFFFNDAKDFSFFQYSQYIVRNTFQNSDLVQNGALRLRKEGEPELNDAHSRYVYPGPTIAKLSSGRQICCSSVSKLPTYAVSMITNFCCASVTTRYEVNKLLTKDQITKSINGSFQKANS